MVAVFCHSERSEESNKQTNKYFSPPRRIRMTRCDLRQPPSSLPVTTEKIAGTIKEKFICQGKLSLIFHKHFHFLNDVMVILLNLPKALFRSSEKAKII
jgi:hypothetical protein